jgi:hypothetical protein
VRRRRLRQQRGEAAFVEGFPSERHRSETPLGTVSLEDEPAESQLVGDRRPPPTGTAPIDIIARLAAADASLEEGGLNFPNLPADSGLIPKFAVAHDVRFCIAPTEMQVRGRCDPERKIHRSAIRRSPRSHAELTGT